MSTKSWPVQSYDTSKRLIRVTDSYGRSLQFGYDANGRLTTLTDPAGRLIRYGYDANGNLVTVKYQDSAVRTYLYNEPANTGGTTQLFALTGILDENNSRFSSITYDASGRATSSWEGSNANRFSVQYPAADSSLNNPVITDPLNNSRTYVFGNYSGSYKLTSNSQGGSDQVCGSCGSNAAVTYDVNGFVQSRTDFNGNTDNYSFSTNGLELSHTQAANSGVARTTTTIWDSTFRLPREVDEPGRTTVYNYDAKGNLLSKTVTDTAAGSSRTTTFSNYNLLAQPQTIDGPRTDVVDATTLQYDTQGNLTQVTDPLNHVTRITSYDPHGNPLTAVDANGVQSSFSYDTRQHLLSRTTAGATTQYTYDAAGQLKSVTSANGRKLIYSYDAAHRLTDVTDNFSNRIHYTLDDLGNRTAEQTYDPNGTLRRTLTRAIDSLGHVSELAGSNGQITRYSYDGNGNLIGQTEVGANGDAVTSSTYDALNRLVKVRDPAAGITNYAYDAFGNLRSVTDTLMLVTAYSYNGFGDAVQLSSPDTGVTATTFDAAGSVITKQDARGVTTTFSYDALNRLQSITYPTAAEKVTYFYDGSNYSTVIANGIGRLTGIADQSGSTTFTYNPRGTLASETHIVGVVSGTTSYSYDAADNLQSVRYPSGDVVNYQLDALGRVTQVSGIIGGATRTLASAIQYLPFGPWTQLTLGNGVTTTRAYDSDYRISRITSGNVLDRAYAYADRRNHITTITDGLSSNKSQNFSYDLLGELTSASGTYGSQTFTYNGASGDRASVTSLPAGNPAGTQTTSSYSYNANSHQLSAVVLGPGIYSGYIYDAAGNRTAANLTTYVYNDAGRLGSLRNSIQSGNSTLDQPIAQYLYDARGRRVSKTVPGLLGLIGNTSSVFGYDPSGHLLHETNASGAFKAEYIWLNDEPLALYAPPTGSLLPASIISSLPAPLNGLLTSAAPSVSLGGATPQIFYYHNDHLGTPQALTDTATTLAWSADYQPFGTTTINTQSVVNNLRFAGQYADAETSLNQNGFRDYDPSIGRYLQSDPIGLMGGINTYAYVGGNPVSFIDPDGRQAIPIPGFLPIPLTPVFFPGTPENNLFVAAMSSVVNAAADAVASACHNDEESKCDMELVNKRPSFDGKTFTCVYKSKGSIFTFPQAVGYECPPIDKKRCLVDTSFIMPPARY